MPSSFVQFQFWVPTVKIWLLAESVLAKVPTYCVVVAGALVRPDGKILMHRRKLGSAHGGLWEFPGGKLEPEESLKSALIRELSEELGIVIAEDSLSPAGFAAEDPPSDLARMPIGIHLYTCRSWSGEVQCLEGEAIGWFDHREIAGLAMPPLDVPLAEQLRQLLVEKRI